MDAIKTDFKYKKHDASSGAQPVRLLKLFPFLNVDHEIECQLLYISLKDPDREQFEALSYV